MGLSAPRSAREVVLHHGRDQADNAARVTARRAGLALRRTASAADVAAAVRRLLDQPAFTEAAERLGESIRRDAAGGALVAELEDISSPGVASTCGVNAPQDDVDVHVPLRDAVRRICAGFPDEYWRTCDADHEFPWEFYRAFAAAGWIGVAIPEEYGGGGAGITEASILLEEVAASGACLNGCSALHLSVFGMNPVVKHGSEWMRRTYLPAVASGELHVSFGVTEPDAGTDTTNISTRATPVPGGYRIRGRKIWNSKANLAQKCLLLVRTTPLEDVRRRTDGMTLFLVDMQVPEVDIRPIPKLGRNAVASCEVSFDDLFVEDRDLVGEEGRGFYHLLDGLNPERILLAAEALGIGRAAVNRAVRYANERIVFGRPIGQNQGISFPLADAHVRLRAAELMIREASARYDAGRPCGEEANAAKYLAADAAYEAADRAVQTHGGMGYAIEYDVERYWREARLIRIAPISQEMVLNYVAEHVLGLPRSY